MINPLAGGVFGPTSGDQEDADLRRLVDDLGRNAASVRGGPQQVKQEFDTGLWRNLGDTGLLRLTSTPESGAGPTELAIVLRGLARHSCAVPLAETDLLAAWLATSAGIDCPPDAPLTVAVAEPDHSAVRGGRVTASAAGVPWLGEATTLVAVPAFGRLLVAKTDGAIVTDGHNLAGEPRGSLAIDLPLSDFTELDLALLDELQRRGAWARCVQTVGALDAAAQLSVSYTRERVQFGRPLSGFQSVQHSLAQMAGELERARAATTAAVAAAADHGFGSRETDYAVTVAKVTLGQVVPLVVAIAHQLHGAVGVTLEHPLWMATMRARSWIDEFGTTAHHARRLGTIALSVHRLGGAPWDALIGGQFQAWE